MSTPLSFYPRPPIDTGMGMHDSNLTGDSPPDIRQHAKNLRKAGFSWYKLLAGGVNKVERARIYNQEGIKPIVRFYVERPHPNWLPNRDEVAQYVAVGAEYIEAGNEQNLQDEVEGQINPEAVARQWVRASDIIKSGGGIPVVYACTPGGHMNHRVYTNRFLAEVKRLGRLDSFDKAVLGIHPRPLNNPPNQPRDTGNPPNTTTWNEWTWYREAYFNVLGWHIPMIATEHGYSGGGQENGEHPPMNASTWAEWNAELFRRFNPAHPKAVSPEFLAACYWLEVNQGVWIHDAPFARDGREWIDDKARPDDRSWGKAIWDIKPTWNRKGATLPPTEPPLPQPPTTPSPLPPRILVDIPDFVTIQDATVAQGQQFWRATKVERRRQATSGGLHHIFSVEPHNPAISTLVEWIEAGRNENRTIPHDKPLNEPAANFSMFGAVYSASIKDGSKPSDKIVGMRMPVNQHESYYITWKLETMPSTTPTPQPPTPNPSPIRWDKVVWAFEQAARTLKNEGYATSHDWVLQSDSYKYAKAQRDGSPAPTPIEPSPLVIDRTRRSLNFNERPTNAAPDVVVLHHTGGSTQSSLNWLSNPASGVSTHYLISKEGKIYEMVSEAKRAWHCGESVFKGRNDVNDFSIGIEIANAGDGVDPYPKAQQDAIVALLSDLKRRGIKRDNVTTHKAIALPKGRKADPSANFPLDEIMSKVYG